MNLMVWALLPMTLIVVVRSRPSFVWFVLVASLAAAAISVFSQILAVAIVTAANIVAYFFGRK